MKKDISLISKVIERDPKYPEGLTYPFYTHEHAHANCTELLWVCEDCGYTSFFVYRNDMICANGIYFCERCHCSQCLTPFYNGYKAIYNAWNVSRLTNCVHGMVRYVPNVVAR